MSDERIYVYKITADVGGAPCLDQEILSLAICKPTIRRTTRVGDLIFAFGINSELPANRLVYIAKVTTRVTDGEYYELPEYADRGDCIYRRANKLFERRSDARFHNQVDCRERDVGLPPDYEKATVLVSNDFRYFGGIGTDDWKDTSPALADMVENLGQGHRVNHPETVREELLALQRSLLEISIENGPGSALKMYPPEVGVGS